MGINLGSMMNNMRSNTTDNGVNVLNLKKNDVLNLTKKNPGLKKVILGAGWDVASIGQDFDLDIAAFLLNANGKVQNIPEDVIFFNNKVGQGIALAGDNSTAASVSGSSSGGASETNSNVNTGVFGGLAHAAKPGESLWK